MTEFTRPENPAASLRHPALVLLGEFKTDSFHIDELQGIEALRDHPGGFYDFAERQELASISTTTDLRQRAIEIAQSFEPMTPEERFDTLLSWREMAEVGSELVSTAQESMRLAAALNEPEFRGKAVAELSLKEREALGRKRQSPEARRYDFPPLPSIPDNSAWFALLGNDRPLYAPIPDDASEHVKDAEDFACYPDVLKTHLLFHGVAEQSADLIGRDVVRGKPVIYDDISTLDHAQTHSRQLPERIASWQHMGLMEHGDVPEYAFYGFGSNYDDLERIDKILAAGKHRSGAVHSYRVAHTELRAFLDDNPPYYRKGSGSIPEQIASLQSHIELLRNVAFALRSFKGHMLNEIVVAFDEATQLIHPEVERQAKRLGAYALSGG